MQGHPQTHIDTHSLAPALEHTHTHASIQPETWDPLSLSRQFVTPTSKLNTRVQELELDVGTFGPNQYKNSCLRLYYHPIL